MFEPFEVPDAESVRLTLTGTVGELKDELTTEIPVRPWGVQAYASASGTSSDGTAVFVGLPKGRTYESPEMMIVISPTLERMIVELALGRDFSSPVLEREFPDHAAPGRYDDRSRGRPAGSHLGLVVSAHDPLVRTPDAQRVSERIQGLVAELIAAQNEDGGWPWVSSGLKSDGQPQPAGCSGQRPARVRSGPLGIGPGRAGRVVAGSQGAGQGQRLADAVDGQRNQLARPGRASRALACPEHAAGRPPSRWPIASIASARACRTRPWRTWR